MAPQPSSSEPELPHAAVDIDVPPGADDPAWAWRQVQPVVPVLPHPQGNRRRLSVVLGAGALFVVLALVSAFVLSLPSNPLTASVAGAGSSPSSSAAARQGFAQGQQTCQDFLSSLAARLNISVTTLETALSGAAGDTIDQLVQQGRLTADQATKLKAAFSAQTSAPCTASGRMSLGLGGLFGGGGMPFARGFGHGGVGVTVDENAILDAAASALKTDRATLQQELAGLTKGQDLKTIAARHGVDYTTLTAAIHAAVKTQLDTAVTKGTLTADLETTLLARVDKALAAGRLPFAAGRLPFAAFGRPFGIMGGPGTGWGVPKPATPTPTPTSGSSGA